LWSILLDPVSFWQVFGSFEGEPIRLDDWQVAFMRDRSRLRAVEKAPQIGFSLCTAWEATWEAIIFNHATTGFVSVDQREANEKILNARRSYEELPAFIRELVPLSKESTEELWFGDPAAPSRLLSIPATAALRGRRMSVYLDEIEYYKDGGKEAFKVALGRITRGGRVTMGSTVFGAGTQLDRVMQGEERNFSRARFPWVVAENEDAQENIRIARQELDPEDFMLEYECVRETGGETFSPALIRKAQHDAKWVDVDDLTPNSEGQVFGYDVGTSLHPSILCGLEKEGDQWLQRVLQEYRGVSLHDQAQTLRLLLRRLPTARLVLDASGIGMGTAQELTHEFGKRVTAFHTSGSTTSAQSKNELVQELRRGMEAEELLLGANKEQMEQFRRTRREPGGKIIQPGTRKKVHYDRFWAVAYAWFGVAHLAPVRSVYEDRGLIVVGRG
jgi:phage FluMu gp28-like protein